MYTFVMPKLRIRIRHLKVVSIYLITKLQTKSLENALQAYFVSYLHELWEQNLLFEVPKLCLCLVLIQWQLQWRNADYDLMVYKMR